MNFKKFQNGDFIHTEIGPIFIKIIGQGPPLIMIHGGPGLDHSYLNSLVELLQSRTLIFYDQIGCGKDQTELNKVNADTTIHQLIALVKALKLNQPFGVFAHSWGTYLALSYIERTEAVYHPDCLILAHPVPLSRKKYDEIGERFISRIPQNILQKCRDLLSGHDPQKGSQMMDLLLPYYCGSSKLPKLDFNYKSEVYDKVTASLGDFDMRESVKLLPSKTCVIFGDKDYINKYDLPELQDMPISEFIIENAGHFSFAEDPKKFRDIIKLWLNDES